MRKRSVSVRCVEKTTQVSRTWPNTLPEHTMQRAPSVVLKIVGKSWPQLMQLRNICWVTDLDQSGQLHVHCAGEGFRLELIFPSIFRQPCIRIITCLRLGQLIGWLLFTGTDRTYSGRKPEISKFVRIFSNLLYLIPMWIYYRCVGRCLIGLQHRINVFLAMLCGNRFYPMAMMSSVLCSHTFFKWTHLKPFILAIFSSVHFLKIFIIGGIIIIPFSWKSSSSA